MYTCLGLDGIMIGSRCKPNATSWESLDWTAWTHLYIYDTIVHCTLYNIRECLSAAASVYSDFFEIKVYNSERVPHNGRQMQTRRERIQRKIQGPRAVWESWPPNHRTLLYGFTTLQGSLQVWSAYCTLYSETTGWYYNSLKGDFLDFFVILFIQHWLICGPSHSTLSEDAEIEPRTRICKPFKKPRNWFLSWRACVHTMFKIWYTTILLSSLLFFGTHMMQGFLCEILLRRNSKISLLVVEVSSRRK